MLSILLAATLLGLSSTVLAKQLPCNDKIPIPEYFGTKVTSLSAKEVRDYAQWGPFASRLGIPFDMKTPINFCNVTVSYTHPGQRDVVNVYVWLPLKGWNGDFFAQGGGGWAAGSEGNLAPAVARGYAAVNTDAGHTFLGSPADVIASAKNWALKSPGNVDWQLLVNFASVSLNDMTHLGKEVTKAFYGKAPKRAYWNGCSTGGRQGLMQAQRYPTNYDGILASAPAINWASFVPAEQFPPLLMKNENYYPPFCEVDFITKAAIEACDEIDGVKDGVVAAAGLCDFDAESIVGQQFDCDGESRAVSKSAARIVNGVWRGIEREGKREWYGLTHEAALAVKYSPIGGLLQTKCDKENKNCTGSRMPISADWIRLYLAKDLEYDLDAMTEEDFFKFLHQSRQEYTSIIGTDDPDLSQFRAAGGKMITWHGLADQLIFPNGTANYYERVFQQDPDAYDYYRYFEAPGVAHCAGGPGAVPVYAFDALVEWVEKGKAPNHLAAVTESFEGPEDVKTRILCPYPQVAAYKGGPPNVASSFHCAASFGSKKASDEPNHSEL